MPKSKRKRSREAANNPAVEAFDQLRPGMPAKDSIKKVVNFVSPQKDEYKILKTAEMDAYDPVPKSRKKPGRKS
jgi:hypothetical protein